MSGIGFDIVSLVADDFSDHKIKCWSTDLIVGSFFDYMNKSKKWSDLGYSCVISDRCSLDYKNEGLEVVSHVAARGSNGFQGKDILTILSHIPPKAIEEMKMALSHLGIEMKRDDVEANFYLDRIRQSCSRVIGYRGRYAGIDETALWVHSRIFQIIQGNCGNKALMPYSLVEYIPELKFIDELKNYVELSRKESALKRQNDRFTASGAVSLDRLDQHFMLEAQSSLTFAEIRRVIKDNGLQAMSGKSLQPGKVAEYFGIEPKNDYDKPSKKTSWIVYGLGIKNNKNKGE